MASAPARLRRIYALSLAGLCKCAASIKMSYSRQCFHRKRASRVSWILLILRIQSHPHHWATASAEKQPPVPCSRDKRPRIHWNHRSKQPPEGGRKSEADSITLHCLGAREPIPASPHCILQFCAYPLEHARYWLLSRGVLQSWPHLTTRWWDGSQKEAIVWRILRSYRVPQRRAAKFQN